MVRRWVPALVLGGVWWWAVLRLVLQPEHAGLVEGAVTAGGWGLSLLPVHVAASVRPTGTIRARAETIGAAAGAWCVAAVRGVETAWRTTRAWRRRRSNGESDPS